MLQPKKISQGGAALISWLVIVVINLFQLLYVKMTVVDRYDWNDVLYYPVTSLTIGLLLIYAWLLPLFKRIRQLNPGYQIPLYILHGLTYTTFYIILIFFQVLLWSDKLELADFWEKVHRFFYTDFHNITKNYFFLLAIFIAIEYLNKREESLLRQKNLENKLKEVKIQALEARLHPHFLFNALNGITALVREDPDKAEEAIVELSDLLRFALQGNFQDPISVNKELEILKKYVSIEKMRFEEQLLVTISVDDSIEKQQPSLPPMILQPMVENAIIHGFKGIQHPLRIDVELQPTSIKVKNNGATLPPDKRLGNGLRIVEQRLKLHFSETTHLQLEQEGGWVVCTVDEIEL